MSTATADRDYPDSPYRRDNFFGDDDSAEESAGGGHEECQGTDPPEYLMFQHLAALTDILCGRSYRQYDREVPLSDPELYLPKQTEQEIGHAKRVTECPACGSASLRRVAPLVLECADCEQEIDDPRTVRFITYRQHRHRRRMNPETGWINWGESTSTTVPEVDEETYMQAIHNYLAENGVGLHNVETWLTYARRLFHDPQFNSKEALRKFIAKKREYDRNEHVSLPE